MNKLRTKESKIGSNKAPRDIVDSTIHKQPSFLLKNLRQSRYDVLTAGSQNTPGTDQCRYRNYVWTISLQIDLTSAADTYIALVNRRASPLDAKIRSDSFRTMATDRQFKEKVSEESLSRVSNAYAWFAGSASSYVQGMNVLCAPFLYVCRTESQAFALFSTLISQHCPLYVTPDLVGVHTGVKLVNAVLELTDPKLYRRLKQKLSTAEIYALASVMTLSACTPPLEESLALWDSYFAYGCSLNIIAVVAQVVDMRTQSMQSDQPATSLRKLPPLNFGGIKIRMLAILKNLPPDLFDLIRRHAVDPSVPQDLVRYQSQQKY